MYYPVPYTNPTITTNSLTNLSPILTLTPSLDPQTVLCFQELPKCHHFATRMQIVVLMQQVQENTQTLKMNIKPPMKVSIPTQVKTQ